MALNRFSDLPLLVLLMAAAALAMLVPGLHAYALRDHDVGRPFLYGAVMLMIFTAMVGLAVVNRPRKGRNHLVSLVSTYAVLPLLLAVPFHQVLQDTRFLNAWFEMLSSFTTTGATLYDAPGRLPPSLHLWRMLVGWLGGFLILVMGVAVLMPLHLGGMEVMVPRRSASDQTRQIARLADPGEREMRLALLLGPAYLGFTMALWMLLVMAGEDGFRALALAMATISTSGILPVGAEPAGVGSEVLIAGFLALAVTRRAFPGDMFADRSRPPLQDPEVRMALGLVAAVTAVLFLRHWVGAIDQAGTPSFGHLLHALWGTAFTALSFLTTTGFVATEWDMARHWSGLGNPGLILMGLSVIGGGVATTAGGVKLLRVYALYRLGERELERLVHPHSVGGGGAQQRYLRGQGAQLAWVFFMLFAMSIGGVVAALTLLGQGFDRALVLAIAALSNTGPIATHAGDLPVRFAELGDLAKMVLGGAMVLGRVEVLAVLALANPAAWRAP